MNKILSSGIDEWCSVCNKLGDSIPGPRPHSLVNSTAFSWKSVTDSVQEVSSEESYRLSMALSREGLISGPSSGMALKGLYNFIEEQKDLGLLHDLAEPTTGEVSCVFPCCDLPYQYMDTYFEKLNADDFNAIINERLSQIDQGTYDPAWELGSVDVIQLNQGEPFRLCNVRSLFHTGTCNKSTDALTVLDLRQKSDFSTSHVMGSKNATLPSVQPTTPSPFDQIAVLEAQSHDVDNMYSTGELDGLGTVLLLCYNGEASRLACSIIRHKGFVAYSVKGGFPTLLTEMSSREAGET